MAVTTTSSSAGALPRPSRLLLPVILLGYVLNIIDVFVVNVALPTLSRTLHAGPAALELVVAGYTVAYACLLVAGGRLGDAFGRRRLFLTGMAAFTVASVLCGLAPGAVTLVPARMLQGAAAALMAPQVLATIQVGYQGAARQRALGVFGAALGLSAAAGQLLGGVIVSADLFGLSWRPVFLVNLPIGLAGLLAARRIVPESRAPRALSLDWAGTVLLAACVLLVMLILAGVPAELAGVAGGALATAQQTATALGIAGIGTLFFSVASGHGYGPATACAFAAEAGLAALTAAAALPGRAA